MGVLELDAYEASGGRLSLVGAAGRESDVDFPEAVDVEQARVLGSCLEAYDVAGCWLGDVVLFDDGLLVFVDGRAVYLRVVARIPDVGHVAKLCVVLLKR